jgi:hypothetical protein
MILERMVRARILGVRGWTSRPEYWQLGSSSILFFVSGPAAAKLGVLVNFVDYSFLIYINILARNHFWMCFQLHFRFPAGRSVTYIGTCRQAPKMSSFVDDTISFTALTLEPAEKAG